MEVLDNLLAKAQRSFEVAEGLPEDTHADRMPIGS